MENFRLRTILKKEKSLGKMSITTSINGVNMVVFSEYVESIKQEEKKIRYVLRSIGW